MIAYVDILSGISGDMFLAALIDAGAPVAHIREELEKLGVEFTIETEKERDVITATRVSVHSEDTTERNLDDILHLIGESHLDEHIKTQAREIFTMLGKAEAQVHGVPVEHIHFHEVGAVDSIVDIVGSLVALQWLGVEKIYASPVLLGRGMVECEHGTLPVPAPATLELLRGKPVVFSSTHAELTTPTGAALLSMAEFSYPEMEIKSIGYGMGKKKLDMPNMLRIVVGNESTTHDLYMIETNIDDMNPEMYPHVIERAMDAGAVDAFIIPVVMKKGRAGSLLSVLCSRENAERVKKTLFEETTTLGIRYHTVRREVLERTSLTVPTTYGDIRVKVGKRNGTIVSISPEYEDCRKAALEKKVPLKEVYAEAQQKARKSLTRIE